MIEKNTILLSLQEVLDDVKGLKTLKSREISIDNIDVVAIRKKLQVTQAEFSKLFGFSLRTLQQWEQGRRQPHGPAKLLLKVIDHAPNTVNEALHI